MAAPSVTALRRWLVFVALLRLLSVYLGFFLPGKLASNLFDKRPDLVNDLQGRTFAVWTLTTCALCLVCARDPRVKPVYGATLFSFCLAAAFFLSEALAFGTVSLRAAANPLAIAAFSAAWMGGGWSYYTRHAAPLAAGGRGGAGGDGGGGGAPPSSVAYPEASEDVETESVSKFD